MIPKNADRRAASRQGGGYFFAMVFAAILLGMLAVMIVGDPGAVPVRTAN